MFPSGCDAANPAGSSRKVFLILGTSLRTVQGDARDLRAHPYARRKEMIADAPIDVELPAVFPVGSCPVGIAVLDGAPLPVFRQAEGQLHGMRVSGERQIDKGRIVGYKI